MKKNSIKQHFFIYFVLVLFFLASGCSKSVKNCELSPDLERIGESALENQKNLSETELRSAIMRCNF
tara:strand:+ start:343 stop:543 length:201 start_codon:yes stop_codon:yes gene_type:complete